MRGRSGRTLAGSVAALCVAAGAPLASEIRLNVGADADQESVRIAAIPGAGRWAAVWESESPANAGIFLRLFDGAGSPLGGEQRVNVSTNGDVADPAVAAGEDAVLVAYSSQAVDGDGWGVAFRRFDPDGVALDLSDVRVNTIAVGPQSRPAAAASRGGDFAVVFSGWTGSDQDVYLRRFTAAGAALDPADIRVNALGNDGVTVGDQGHPAVAFAPDGGLVVVYEDRYLGRAHGVRFDAAGVAMQVPGEAAGARQFAVAPALVGEQTRPDVCGLADGGFAVAMNAETGAVVRRAHAVTFASSGIARASFPLGAHSNRWEDARLDGLAAGGFVAAWQAAGAGADASNGAWSVHTQRFGPDGTPFNAPHRVNAADDDDQDRPHAAASGDDYAIAWRSHGPDGSGYGVFQDLFAGPVPTELDVGPAEDGLPVVAFPAVPHEIYGVETSTDLASWTLVLLTNSPTGVLDILDVAAPSHPQRFFRAWQYE